MKQNFAYFANLAWDVFGVFAITSNDYICMILCASVTLCEILFGQDSSTAFFRINDCIALTMRLGGTPRPTYKPGGPRPVAAFWPTLSVKQSMFRTYLTINMQSCRWMQNNWLWKFTESSHWIHHGFTNDSPTIHKTANPLILCRPYQFAAKMAALHAGGDGTPPLPSL